MGQLHINEGNSFRQIKNWTASITDRGAEDMATLFFDADGDGDLDLFVASGGVEAPPGHQIYSDRLYMNNGSGYFNRTPASIPGPPVSSGPACAADFDRDGDLDLFVGGRVIPSQYPMAPGSRLLINDGKGIFIDKTTILAPTLLMMAHAGIHPMGVLVNILKVLSLTVWMFVGAMLLKIA